jgi:hypothetical protein
MVCPSCGTEAPDDLPECVNCGQVLLREIDPVSLTEIEPELLTEVEPELLTEIEPELLTEVEPEPPREDTIEGLERTRFEAAPSGRVEPLPGLEATSIAEEGFPPPDEPLLDIEPTQVRSPAGATPVWEGTLPGFDAGRESDDGLRTPAAGDVSVCVHCGAHAKGMFCESCGHRRTAAERPAPRDETKPAEAEAVLCPACFARRPPHHDDVRGIDRCGECGMPLPQQDLL